MTKEQKAGDGLGGIQRGRNVILVTEAVLKTEFVTETTIVIKMTVFPHSQWEKSHRWNKAEEICCGVLLE